MSIEQQSTAEEASFRTSAYSGCIRPWTANSHGRLDDTCGAMIQSVDMLKVQKAGCVTKREDAKPEVLANQRSLYQNSQSPSGRRGYVKALWAKQYDRRPKSNFQTSTLLNQRTMASILWKSPWTIPNNFIDVHAHEQHAQSSRAQITPQLVPQSRR